MPSNPSSLALTSIAEGAQIISSDHRNNYSTVQTAFNALLTALGGGGAAVAGSELSYIELTSNVNVTATTEATANTVVTAAAVTFDGATSIIVEFYAPYLSPGTNALSLVLYDGANSIGRVALVQPVGPPKYFSGGSVKRKLTPSAAAHTYSIRGYVDAGTGVVAGGAGGIGVDMPAFIRITKV